MDKTWEGATREAVITGYASDGAGVARLDGEVIFVAGALRGEACEVKIDKVGRSAAWGHVVRVAAPSGARLAPDCPRYEACGGCMTRHMSYVEELSYKRGRVEEALHRIGGLDLNVSAIHAAARPDRYRNKAQFPVSPGPNIGFYRKRTHQVVDAPDCLLQSEAAARLRAAVKAWMERWDVSAYDERSGRGLVRHVYVRTNRRGESLCCLMVSGKKLPREAELVSSLRACERGLTGVVLGVNEKRNNVILGDSYRTLWGADFLTDTLCGLAFRLSVPSFYQVNPDQAEILYGRALDFAGLTGKETVLDLYCGIGTISLVMAGRAARVIGVEVVPKAVEDAKENAARNGIQNADFFCADALQAASRLDAGGVRPDVVCVDPPRKGLAEEVVGQIAAMGPNRVVYVSCDPGTLARDLKRFAALGYAATRAEAVDLFPRTAHVESVVLLSQQRPDDKIEIDLDLREMRD